MNIVFLISTEYHLSITLGVISQYYPETKNKIKIYRVSPLNGKRLNNINQVALNCQYEKILYDFDSPKRIKEKIDEIINDSPNILFFFLEERPWLTYMFSKLHKTGTKIVLLPDGMKVYMPRKISYVMMLKNTFKNIINNTRIGIPFPIAKYPCMYATNKYIDEVWMEYPDYYVNSTKKTIKRFSMPNNPEFIEKLNQVFCFSISLEEKRLMQNAPILLLDSPFYQESYYKNMIEILNRFQAKYPNRTLLIKQHQLSSEKAKVYYDELGEVHYLKSTYPAELYIANLKNAVVISMYSTAMLFKNPTCQYFWVGNCFRGLVNFPKIVNPSSHIQVISSVEEIK